MNLAKQRFWERGADAQTTMDALPCVFLSENKMVAWLFLFPPTGGGKPASLDRLEHSVCEAGVLFGIDHERLQQLADSPEYFQLSVVAYGLAPIPGDDGRIVELVPRERRRLRLKRERRDWWTIVPAVIQTLSMKAM